MRFARRVLLACVIAASAIAGARSAYADEKAAPTTPEDAPPPIVRMALSRQAEAFLTEGRMRRLIGLELPASTKLADEPTGPLDESAVRLYIDLPEPTVVTIQVSAPQRKVETRRVDVAGLAWDVAARVTAIAASESVRSELEPVRRRPPRPREPTDDDLAAWFHRTPAISIDGAFELAILPSVAAIGGTRLSVGFHQPVFSEEISIAALTGGGSGRTLEWLDGSIGLAHRFYFLSRLRSEIGGSFALGHAELRGPPPGDVARDFTLRAAGLVSLDARVVDHAWLSLRVQPGGIVLDAPKRHSGRVGECRSRAHDRPFHMARHVNQKTTASHGSPNGASHEE